jgi:hypothetical protein
MKHILVFFIGLVCGMAILLQVQNAAYKIEADCLNAAQHNGTLTKQSCKQESKWLEKIT